MNSKAWSGSTPPADTGDSGKQYDNTLSDTHPAGKGTPMKIRFRGDSIRLRLTLPEVVALGGGGAIEEITHFPDGATLRCRLETSAGAAALSACFADGLLLVRVGSRAAVHWGSDPIIKMESALPLPGGGELRVLMEKDLECLHPSDGERTEGAFPNPARSLTTTAET